MTIYYVSLFSGIGGLDLAAASQGWEPILFCERDSYCQAVLALRFPGVPIVGDIHDLTLPLVLATCAERGIPSIDAVIGGFPCQPNSLAGKRAGRADERNLWPEFARVVRDLAPRWVVGENVSGLRSANVDRRRGDSGLFGDVLRDLAEMGYVAGWGSWEAADAGAPHKRERVFLVAHAKRGLRRLVA
jgi:DNA (cytosine-5)-methyltransferase 1